MADFIKQTKNFRLTTAEILYHLPDHPALLQTFLWQDYDLIPSLPVLMKFLDFWEREIEGKLHTVKVAACGVITASEYRMVDGEFVIQ